MREKKIGILCGGFSDEREVSLRSGANVHRILNEGGYDVVLLDLKEAGELTQLLESHKIQAVFNVLHGEYGEDGGLQKDLQKLGILYTGCGPLSSQRAMNKVQSKHIAQELGMSVPKYYELSYGKNLSGSWEEIRKNLPFPWFIKPLRGGSSCDTHLIKEARDLESMFLDSKKSYLIEEVIKGQEVTSGVLTTRNFQVVFPILGLLPTNEFYDYEAKYTEGKTKFLCPAPLSQEIAEKIMDQSLKMHRKLGCSGSTRSDFIIQQDTNIPYFLETNTSPGMTKLSDIPAEAKALGWSELYLCERILDSLDDIKS